VFIQVVSLKWLSWILTKIKLHLFASLIRSLTGTEYKQLRLLNKLIP
jgi:hypothetical protein